MMCCPILCISTLLALLVLLGGLFLLAYAKKEGLGMITKITSWLAILIAAGCLICCLICALMCAKHGGNMGGCHGGKCGPGTMKCDKEMMMKHHGMGHGAQCCKGDKQACDHHGEKESKTDADTLK